MLRLDCHDRIKQVKSRYETARQTVNMLISLVKQQPQYLYDNNLSLMELQALEEELHSVYFIRMFACFESSLRHYWRTSVKNTKPQTKQLLSSIAGRRGVPQDTLGVVHEIREFRNFLIHEEHEVGKQFTIDEAIGQLNTYLARLPLQW